MWKAIVLVIFLCYSVSADDLYASFQTWADEYLPNAENRDQHYQQWKENADYVNYHNSQNYGFKLKLNQFAHMKLPIKNNFKGSYGAKPAPKLSAQLHDLPPSIDWRDKYAISAVKNQGKCGSSEAIVFLDAVTSAHFLKVGYLEEYSMEQLLACCMNNNCNGEATGADSADCINKYGLCPESDYHCPTTPCTCHPCDGPVLHIKNMEHVTSGNETALAVALVQQPVMVTVDAGHTSFELYHEGVYSNLLCSSKKVDHTMLLIGYGTYEGQDFWLCKNSWGPDWGMKGYIMIARNKHNMCGIATAAMFPVLDE